MRKRYWLVALGTYGALYATGFGAVYAVLATGLVDPMVSVARTSTFCLNVKFALGQKFKM